MLEPILCNVELELDGGIDPTTAPLGVSAGGTVLVAGTSIFGTGEPVAASIDRLRKSFEG